MFLPVNLNAFKKAAVCLLILLGCIFASPTFASRNAISFLHIGTEQGLPQSTVNTIYQDSQGFMWIGTYDGLTRYDGYRFVNFKNNPQDPGSLSDNIVVSIIEDDQGYLWIGTAQNGVNRFNPKNGEFTRFISKEDDFDSLSNPQVRVIHQDNANRIWVGTDQGLNLFLPEKQAFAHFLNNPLDNQSLPDGAIVDIVDDGNGNLWIASDETLAHFDIDQQVFTYYQGETAPENINDLYLDTDNSLWIGTLFDGLYHLRPDQNDFEQYMHDESDPESLANNDVRSILRVASGDLWVGTNEGGLNIRRKGANKFQRFSRNSADNHSLTINDIWSMYQDRSGLIWVGTAGGGINITMSFENRLSRLTHAPHQSNGLSHEFVWDIEEDNNGLIWIATLNGLDQYDPTNDKFVHFTEFFDSNNQPIGNRIQAFAFDHKRRIWFGNQQGQLAVFDPNTKQSQLIQRKDFRKGYVSSNRIRMVESDRFGNIWVGTDDGLLKIDSETLNIANDYNFVEQGQLGNTIVRTMLQDEDGIIWFGTWNKGLQRYDPEFGTLLAFENKPGDETSISDNSVRSLYKDNSGNLWVGTFNGLNLLSAEQIQNKDFQFKSYLEKDGLPNSAIHGIVAAANGNLWLGTNRGLSELDPNTGRFTNYTIEDGLTTNEFTGNAVTRSLSDEIYFGSVNGVTIVNPITRTRNNFQPQVKITGINVQGKPFLPHGVPYQQQPIELQYNENDLFFEFASLDFRHPERNRFRYRLIPYNDQWTESGLNNQAVFTNLDPNRYTFELKATNSDGNWVDEVVKVTFTIKPPMWQTWWAYFLYFALVIALLAYYLNKHERSLQEQKAINEHLRRVDQLKDEFLANTSHELRTPLNGIIGIAESLKEGIAGLQNQKTLNHLQLIIDGGKRLAQLVNDILDFKKLSHHNLVLQRKAVDLSSIVNVVVSLLRPLALEKSLQIVNSIPAELPLIYADENRIQQVLHNLIGNAIKYTNKGLIEISANSKNNFVEVCVSDTGMGIDNSQLEVIFEPFEQASLPETISHRGTGLGLSVSHQLIEEHGGNLWAVSKLDEGSQFYFEIPMWLENIHEVEVVESITHEKPARVISTTNKSKTIKKRKKNNNLDKGKVLIADDDPINLQVLSDLLQMNGYQVVSAEDGLKAVELGEQEKFDLAIIDIMMPGLSGYDVCKRLRKKYTAIELPILLLSARNQPGDISAGFEAGANDYVTKPIEREVLLSRIHTMSLLRGLVDAKQQQEHTATLQQACERMGKYFPKQMVKQIITNDTQNPLVAMRKQITVLFADLAGFTSISDRFEPESITDILNSFLGKMGQLIENKNGVLNEILGDGLVVFFGALDNMDKQLQAKSAAKLALEMQQAMTELSEQWLEAGFDHNVKLRIGIHQDFATVGNFGSEDIVAFRAVGSGINLASRLENYSPSGKITVSYPIYAQCRNEFDFTELEEIQFKGFNHPHRVCQLVGESSD
ncbi:two-component regulator propeller domain-containing protein [Aliikangiella coralliicola]|uniref:histidine kinase n=1 Tax=Aliikangiella coralliicola TaxID=2592383 RepID=A0A545UGT1_9GAMM|nr:two-component regulator propeller domain-containing protein [Aliikangiella coralliicola]TQV88659.1 response regulator [Aliikangiella coralliicola]